MPRNAGPIAVMLMEHEVTRKLTAKMEESANKYIKSGDATQLISDMQEYINHVVQHIWKENNRLFEMADKALINDVDSMKNGLLEAENSKLKNIGKTREDYENFAEDISKLLPSQD